jgi:vitamin B12 transporter
MSKSSSAQRAATLLAAGVAALSSAPVAAAGDAGTVVVTAARRPQQLSRVLSDVSVLEREAIERSGATCAVDLLAQLPGIEYARSGGPAGITSVFLRGSEARHTAVYIDGVRVDDQATGGARWEMLPIDQIERVEVLRGPAAAIYGSDAIGGVVQLFTRQGGGQTTASAALSVGNRDAVHARAAVSGVVAGFDYALSASQARSDGFNARETATSNPDRDGWDRSGIQARLGREVAAGHRIDLALLASNLWGQYDQSRTADDVSRQTLRTVNLSWQGRWSDMHDTRVQVGESQNMYESKPSYYRTETTLRNFSWQQGLKLGAHLVTLLAERKEDRLLNPATAYTATLRGERHQDALALGWQAELGKHAWQAHLRHDQDSEFGGQPSGSLAWGWQFDSAWRVTASAASAFRAPTLYQRFSEYGNATLVPEKSRNVELGLRWADGASSLSATAWRTAVRDLIGFGAAGPCASTYGCYENVNRARYLGATLAGQTRWAGVALRGSLDWHDPRNLDTDKLLARRARVLAKLSADTAVAGWGLGLDWQAAGRRYDNATNTVPLAGYGVLHLRATRALAPGWTLEARVDNLFDRDYQLAATYPTGGRIVQVGLRWQLL